MTTRRGRRRVHAALALIERRGRYLVSRRTASDHLGGYWEFPGGKRRIGETWEACLRREVREELGVAVIGIRLLGWLRHRYPRRPVFLKVYRCTVGRGTPRPLNATALRWIPARQLAGYRFPSANRALIAHLAEGARIPGAPSRLGSAAGLPMGSRVS